MPKPWILFAFCGLFFTPVEAQSLRQLSLSEAYTRFENHYPILQNINIQDQIYQMEMQQLDIAKKPTIDLLGDGRIQSESTSLDTGEGMVPFEIDQPLVSIRTYIEANYNLLDGGINTAQRQLKAAQLNVEKQNLEVERFGLRPRINQLFVNISLLREQSKLIDISLEDLKAREARIAASVEQGVALESEQTKIEVKQLELVAQQDNIAFQVKGLVNTLGQLIGETLAVDVELIFPELPSPEQVPELNRPEQELFRVQRDAIMAQSDLIEANRRPKLSAYAQAGVGYPNPLNILDNNVAPYGTLGARFNWPITDWKKSKVDKELLTLQAQKIRHTEATFAFNIDTQTASYQAETSRLQAQIQHDEAIARLQADILQQLAAQLDEGVITSTEYITQVNAELRARQNLVIHQTELLKTQLEFLNDRGQLIE